MDMKYEINYEYVNVPDDDLVEDIILETHIFFREKIQDPQSDDDNVCALFPFWRRCFWRISFVVRVLSSVVVRDDCCEWFITMTGSLFSFSLSFYFFSWLCASVMSLDILLVQRWGVIDIFVLLIYSFYKKIILTTHR
jgi:hypothetical protein